MSVLGTGAADAAQSSRVMRLKRAGFATRGCSLYSKADGDRLAEGVARASRAGGGVHGEITLSSGDARLDRALGLMLADLSRKFAVRPGFGFYDDSDGANAVAMPNTRLEHSRGTVLFGQNLFQFALNDSGGDIFAMAICAHEFGHIVQMFSPFQDRMERKQATVKRLELHADYLSGFFLGSHAGRYSPSQLVGLGRSWERIGDSNYTDPDHHGTSEERLSAVEAGFALGRKRPSTTIRAVCEAGAVYLNA